MEEKKISKRRLRYIENKLDDYWFDHLHPNEILDIMIILRDMHSGDAIGPGRVLISRFGKSYDKKGN